MAPTDVAYREEHGLELMQAASPKLTLPPTAEELRGAKNRGDSTPQELAGEFVLYDDPMDLAARDPRFMERYALAVFYYQNGGCSGDWVNNAKWLSTNDHCEGWHGVVCDLKGRVIEMNMGRNYITGKIPVEFSALEELSTLDLSNNAMVGTVPAAALSMPKMYTISLNNNKFEGDFPFQEVKQGATILDNLWVQENPDLEGTITDDYCSLNTVTLDCENFNPGPVYPATPNYPELGTLTTFEEGCIDRVGRFPAEYTCNFDDPVPPTKPPATVEEENPFQPAPAPEICGTPAAGTR
jgi:hypothetical protein